MAVDVRRARRRAGMTQEALAAASRLHRTELSLLERGERDPRVSTIVRIARALGIEPCDLLAAPDATAANAEPPRPQR